jgi:hypothetical protein
VAADVRAWALEHGADPDYRIVLAGFGAEHDELLEHGWRKVEWFKAGFLRGGNQGEVDDETGFRHQQGEERLWLSPHCLGAEEGRQGVLF